MIILGINESHGASACLNIDGEIVAAVAEERFSRIKIDETFPRKSIDFCLDYTGIKPSDIDFVALASYDLNPLYSVYKRNCGFSVDDWIKEQELYWKPKLFENKTPSYRDIFSYRYNPAKYPFYYDFSEFISDADWEDRNKFLELRKKHICNYLNIAEEKIKVIKHYDAHSAYAFYASQIDRDETLVFHAESGGDGMNASISRFDKNKGLQKIILTNKCFLGRIYKFLTLILGMLPAKHEYKIMGLAPYASNFHVERSYKVFEDLIKVEGLDFVVSEDLTDSYHYFVDKLRGHRFDGIAGALQKFAEVLILNWVNNAVRETGVSQVVFSGGVSMNVKINKLICEMDSVKNVFVPPSGSDDSLCMGASYKVLENLWNAGEITLEGIKPLTNAYLGPEYEAKDVENAIGKYNISENFKVIGHISAADIAKYLVEGKVIARLAGRMEFGARALGNRSILASPSIPNIVKKINDQIKCRDFWMPFCPTIKAERMNDYIVDPKNIRSPHMAIAFDTVESQRENIKGAIHPQDYTCRPQIIEESENPEYYKIISEFEKLTGIGVVLNTSLNLHGNPIDCTPEDGLYTFINSELDCIVLGNTLVMRK